MTDATNGDWMKRVRLLDQDRVARGKLLRRVRDMLVNPRDHLDDVGDLVSFGSTNDADTFRDAVQMLEDWRWDDIMREGELPDLVENCRKANERADAAEARVAELERLINSPETDDWLAGARLEAAHQVERWGADHDAGKKALDWFWLIGYLAQKAAAAQIAGDTHKAKHHTISTAAALLNWHRALTGSSTTMRPGIDPSTAGLSHG